MDADRGERSADLARLWAGALGRLLLFGLLFVVIAESLTLAVRLLDPAGGAWNLVLGGTIWLVAALGAGAALLRWLDRRSWRAMGMAPSRDALRQWARGMAIGVAMIAIAVSVLALSRGLVWGSDEGTLGGALATMAGSLAVLAPAAAAEEALFRGYPIQVLAKAGGVPLAVLTTSVAFAAVHGQNPAVGPLALANIFLAGVLLAVVFMRTGSLWAATGVHLGWNWGMGGLFDLPVSGLGWIDVPAFEPWIVGPRWWTGGDFGPEGGVLGSLVFGGALLFALRTPWLPRRPDEGPRTRMLCAVQDDRRIDEGTEIGAA